MFGPILTNSISKYFVKKEKVCWSEKNFISVKYKIKNIYTISSEKCILILKWTLNMDFVILYKTYSPWWYTLIAQVVVNPTTIPPWPRNVMYNDDSICKTTSSIYSFLDKPYIWEKKCYTPNDIKTTKITRCSIYSQKYHSTAG